MLRASSVILLLMAALHAVPDDSRVAATIEQQRNAAIPRTYYIPYYSIADGDETELFFVSKITDPLRIDLFAISPYGQQVYLGQEILLPSRNASLKLSERLRTGGDDFDAGFLRLDFVGDGGALQAWAVIRSGRQSFEVPFVPSDKMAVNELFSYWDTATAGPRPKLQVEYRVTNTTTAPVSYTMTLSRGARVARTDATTIGPLQTRTHIVSDSETTHRGWLRLTHNGPAGAIVGAGVVRAEERLSYLPLVTRASLARGPGFEVLRIPDGGNSSTTRTRLTLFNSGDTSQSIAIEAVSQASGTPLGTKQQALEPWEVRTVDVEQLFGRAIGAGTRLRVRGSSPSLLVDGAVVSAGGEVLDLSVHAALSAHKSGTYPIPDLDRYDVRTTIVNLGSEDSEIVAQYFWDGGTYAVPLRHVPPGRTLVLDPRKLAEEKTADLLRRTLDPAGKHLALKWSVRSGSQELIGRTEAKLRGALDGFGFNCGGCCWQIPDGGIVPGEVEVGLGESPSFEAVVWFDTCSGRLGPWSAGVLSSDVPWPFSWNYSTLSVSDGADADIGFETVENEIDYGCIETRSRFWKFGRGLACDKVHNPKGYKKTLQCTVQANPRTCAECKNCCLALYNARVCKGELPVGTAQQEREACYTACETDLGSCPEP